MRSAVKEALKRLRGKTSLEEGQAIIMLNQLTEERDTLRQCLHVALETINFLDTQLAEYNSLLENAQTRLSERTELSKSHTTTGMHKPQVESSTDLAWIENTWLCSRQTSAVFGEAEEQWKGGRPQQALILVQRVLSSNSNLGTADELKCRLFMAALVHYGGKHKESNKLVDTALRMIQDQRRMTYSQAREIRGIAHFIQGKNLMGLRRWHMAYWAFSKALYTPGYHSKAQFLQKEAIDNSKRDDTTDE